MREHTPETKAEVVDLRSQGLSYKGIVMALADQGVEISRTTVIRWVKESQRQDFRAR